MESGAPIVAVRRTESERRAFREAHGLLVAFGVGAVPATLLLCLMGVDFLEGDFGISGTLVMMLAGGMSLVCAMVGAKARRMWSSGATLHQVYAMMSWSVLIPLVALFVCMFSFAGHLVGMR